MMEFKFFDILSVSIIGITALVFVFRAFGKMRKNKCATLCNGCSGSPCSTKKFQSKSNKKVISLKSTT